MKNWLRRLGRWLNDHQVKDHSGIECAASCSHREAIESSEAHRRIDATSCMQSAQAGSIAEMSDDDAAVCDIWCD